MTATSHDYPMEASWNNIFFTDVGNYFVLSAPQYFLIPLKRVLTAPEVEQIFINIPVSPGTLPYCHKHIVKGRLWMILSSFPGPCQGAQEPNG